MANYVHPFHAAAAVGDIDTLTRMLAAGTPIDLRDEEECTALMFAALNDQHETATFLIENGADVNAEENSGVNTIDLVRFIGDGKRDEDGNLTMQTLLEKAGAVSNGIPVCSG